MSKRLRLLRWVVSLASIVTLSMSSLPAAASPGLAAPKPSTSTTIPLLGLAWDHTSITYSVIANNSVSPTAIAAIQQGIANWNTSLSNSNIRRLSAFQLVPAPAGQTADLQIRVKGGTGEVLGSTHLFPNRDGSIDHVSMLLSGKAFGGILSSDIVTTIAVHELGHVMGLGHTDDPSDPMYPYINGVDLYPSACDIQAFAVVEDWYVSGSATFYPPTVSSVTCG